MRMACRLSTGRYLRHIRLARSLCVAQDTSSKIHKGLEWESASPWRSPEMFRKTGPGQIEVDSAYTGAGVLKALLYNFDFDDSDVIKHNDLKAEFTRFLTDRVVPLLE